MVTDSSSANAAASGIRRITKAAQERASRCAPSRPSCLVCARARHHDVRPPAQMLDRWSGACQGKPSLSIDNAGSFTASTMCCRRAGLVPDPHSHAAARFWPSIAGIIEPAWPRNETMPDHATAGTMPEPPHANRSGTLTLVPRAGGRGFGLQTGDQPMTYKTLPACRRILPSKSPNSMGAGSCWWCAMVTRATGKATSKARTMSWPRLRVSSGRSIRDHADGICSLG